MTFISANRILISRIFVILFFFFLLFSKNNEETNMVADILFLIGIFLVGIATVGRLWCSLYISGYKDNQLITAGPYSICRNPLYFFSFLGFLGIGFVTETFTFVIFFGLFFAIFYPIVIKKEEAVLKEKFGTVYENYCQTTPRFFPNFKGFNEPQTYLVNPKLFRKTMIDVLWFIWLVGIIEFIEVLHENHLLTTIWLLL